MNAITLTEHDPDKYRQAGFIPCTVRCEHGWMEVTHQLKEDTLCISHVHSDKRGTMKAMIQAVIKRYGTRKLLFYNCLTDSLPRKLRGFKREVMMDPVFEEPALCYRGEWEQ